MSTHPQWQSTPPAAAHSAPQRTNGLAIAALIVGIVGCCVPLFGFVPGLAALIMGIIAMQKIKGDPTQGGKGLAIAGIVLGAVSFLWLIVLIIYGIAFFTIFADCMEYGWDSEECEALLEDLATDEAGPVPHADGALPRVQGAVADVLGWLGAGASGRSGAVPL